jgi:serine/threonine protein phosphatase PrpC
MEDACSVIGEFAGPKTQYFGLFDGHGGSQASHYCATTLHKTIARLMRKSNKFEEVLTDAIAEVNASCSAKWTSEGSCAALAILIGDTLWTANVGDSRVILVHNGTATRLTYDHKASDPEERKGVLQRGGHIINERVNGTLALARAIGDGHLGEAVSCVPYIKKLDRKDGMMLILACDGVWDVMTDQEAADFVIQIANPLEAAKAIKDEALNRGSTDNVSVMVVNLTPKKEVPQ